MLIWSHSEMDAGIEEAVATIIWVTPRMSADIQELQQVFLIYLGHPTHFDWRSGATKI